MGSKRIIIDNVEHKDIGVVLRYISASKDDGEWHSTLHAHFFTELFYVVSGQGSFVVEEESFTVKGGDFVAINANIEHTEHSVESSRLEYIVLGIDGLDISQSSNKSYLHFTAGNEIGSIFKLMLEECEGKEENFVIICQRLLDALVLKMMRNTGLLVCELNKKTSRECGIVKRYIDANYSSDITLDKLAELSHMNKYYLVHAFGRYTGLSPIEYLSSRRIEESKSLLCFTDHSISQIAEILGYSSQSYYSQAFKKAVLMTPREYRRLMRQKNVR